MSADKHGGAASLDDLRVMDTEELMVAGAVADGVHFEHRGDRYPVTGTKIERRRERAIAVLFVLSGLAAIAFMGVFIFAPWEWHLPEEGSQDFKYYTPLLGATMAFMLFALGFGIILWARWLMPHEVVVQERHDEPSAEEDRLMTGATIVSGFNDTGLPRRKLITRSLLFAIGPIATVPLVGAVGAFIVHPRNRLFRTLFSPDYVIDRGPNKGKKVSEVFPNGVPLVYSDGRRIGPDDLQPGGLATVFPGVPHGIRHSSSPTLVIRLRPGQRVKPRKINGRDQANFQWGDYVAFSKICTHAGCPASLYEQQTSRLLCPCHQSQFDVLQDAKPVFGPATRALPKLPLSVEEVDGKLYFVAKEDYPEAIGPAFWERP